MRNQNNFVGLSGVALLMFLLFTPATRGGQWPLSQFPTLAPIITFETGSTALPGIGGLTLSGGDATFAVPVYNPNEICFGGQFFGNFNGNTYLDITFRQPQQAVGAYIINADSFHQVTGVMEVLYDNSNNILDSASQSYPPSRQPPVFLGLGETTTNIYKVEWRYTGTAGYFGVDNVIYSPGPSVVLTNVLSAGANLHFSFQTIPGHTNTIQTSSALDPGTWTNVTDIFGDGGNRQISVPVTNSPAGFFRVQVH